MEAAKTVAEVYSEAPQNRRVRTAHDNGRSIDENIETACALRTLRLLLRLKVIGTRNGAAWLAAVTSATVTVHSQSCISGSEITMQGDVLWISLPIVASSAASQISPRLTFTI